MKPVILVIDDEEAIRLFLQATLEDEGYEVMTVGTGGEAFRGSHPGFFPISQAPFRSTQGAPRRADPFGSRFDHRIAWRRRGRLQYGEQYSLHHAVPSSLVPDSQRNSLVVQFPGEPLAVDFRATVSRRTGCNCHP